MRIYLDVCCLNRPFDDQTQGRIHLESEAVLLILDRVENQLWSMLGSDAIRYEISRISDAVRRRRVTALSGLATQQLHIDDSVVERATQIGEMGVQPMDAMHLALAQSGGVDVFLTVDDKLLQACARSQNLIGVRAMNPVQLIAMEALS